MTIIALKVVSSVVSTAALFQVDLLIIQQYKKINCFQIHFKQEDVYSCFSNTSIIDRFSYNLFLINL